VISWDPSEFTVGRTYYYASSKSSTMRGKIVIRPTIEEHSLSYNETENALSLDNPTQLIDEIFAKVGWPLILHVDTDADIFIAYDTGRVLMRIPPAISICSLFFCRC